LAVGAVADDEFAEVAGGVGVEVDAEYGGSS
jgi:hypothetical protein